MRARRTTGRSGSWFVPALAIALFCSAASAATFGLSPLRVDLSGAAPTAVLTLTNGGDTPVTLQIQARSWRQVNGQDEQAPTTDFIVNPAAVTVPPGGEQIVRIALRTAPDRTTERAYRLVVREVPVPEPGAAPGSLGLRMALAMDIPAYVAPVSTDGVARPSFTLERSPEGAIRSGSPTRVSVTCASPNSPLPRAREPWWSRMFSLCCRVLCATSRFHRTR